MRRYRVLTLSSIGFLVLAGLSGLVLAGLMNSMSAFRSPFRAEVLPEAAALGEAHTERLVIVLVDALRYDTSLDSLLMPALVELRAKGASAVMLARPPSYSEPTWAALLSGAYPELSGAPLFNLTYDELSPLPAETLFSVSHRAGLVTAVSGYNWFERMIPAIERDAGFFTAGEDHAADVTVLQAALPWLAARDARLILIHLDQVDYAGHHEGGPRDPHWAQAAARVDGMLQSIIAQIDLERDTLLVVGDHGQIDRGGHGGQDAEALRTVFVAAGAGVNSGDLGTIAMADVAPTMAALLGVPMPSANQGHLLPILTNPPQSLSALAQQQTALAQAYLTAIGQPGSTAGIAGAADPVAEAQAVIQHARESRLAGERLPRAVISVAALALITAAALRSRRALAPLALPALSAVVFFHLLYVLVEQRTYSLSSVESQTGILTAAAVNGLAGYLLGVAFVTWQAWRHGERGVRVARSLQLYTLLAAAMILPLLLPGYWDFGLRLTWTLPNFLFAFLAFLGLLQLVLTCSLGVVLPPLIGGGTYLLERIGAAAIRSTHHPRCSIARRSNAPSDSRLRFSPPAGTRGVTRPSF